MTTMAHDWKPSEAQIELLKTVFKERVADSEPNREQFWKNLTQNISNRASFQTALDALKARDRVRPVYTPPAQPVAPDLSGYVLATEDGLYRDPEDGTLYRLSTPKAKHAWDHPSTVVSVYSNKAVYRRLTPEGRMVKKGKWTRLKAYESRSLISFNSSESRGYKPVGTKILASWFLNDEQKTEWAVGICLMCYKSLIDAVSVFNSIGPVCARNWGVQLHTPPEA